jgi:catechol 2,3-dioxygenase-like lactoylglutathione lyase family enzyme
MATRKPARSATRTSRKATANPTPAGKRAPRTGRRRPVGSAAAAEFNHAMIYTSALDRALAFYRDALGFRVVDEYPGGYARLKSPRGSTTIALHALEPGARLDPGVQGIRLYFEVAQLDAFCESLLARGVAFEQPPRDMPWGWRHAYLRDPDGHEISLYRAGGARLRRTSMRGDDHA